MENQNKHIVIIGATSAIAEHCARLWAMEKPALLTLVGRSAARLQDIVHDLKVRSPETNLSTMPVDFNDPQAIAGLANALSAKSPVDLVLIAHGSLPDQQACQQNLSAASEAIAVNALSPVLFAEAFATPMEKAGRGTIVVIGSVAGDRGRKSNYVYGAAKGLVARYVEGMQHRFAASKVRVVLVKPGPTDTPMTAHLKAKGIRLASVEDVAAEIVQGVAKGKNSIYAPRKWALIMVVIRHLPSFIFNRMNI